MKYIKTFEEVDQFERWKKYNKYTIRYTQGGYEIFQNRKSDGSIYKSEKEAVGVLKNIFDRDKDWK